jgi:hypothetical protein
MQAQKEAYNWTFGAGTGLSWNTTKRFTGTIDQLYGTTTSIANLYLPTSFQSNINTYEGCFALSDPQTGKLMFYSDGVTLYDADGSVIETGLGGHASSVQSGVLLPYPGIKNAGKFIALSINQSASYMTNAQYAIIDTNGGTTTVTSKNNELKGGLGYRGESMNVIRHSNKKDFWIVVPGCGNTTGAGLNTTPYLNVWKVTEDGVAAAAPEKKIIIPFKVTNNFGTPILNRYFKFSPDGKYFVWGVLGTEGMSFIYGKFNAETGEFSDIKKHQLIDTYNTPRGAYSVEFSKSGKALYVTDVVYLFALDFETFINMQNPSTYNAKCYELGGSDGLSNNLTIGSLQLAPDGYIYGTWYDRNKQPTNNPVSETTGARKHMIVITNPESPSALKIYRLNNFLLGGGHLGLTTFSPSWFAMQIEGPKALCSDPVNGVTATYSINMSGSERPATLRWYWDANGSSYETQTVTGDVMSKSHTFAATNSVITQTIKILGLTDSGALDFTDTYEVTIYPKPIATADPIDACVGNTVTLSPTTVSDGAEVKWYTTATGGTPLASTGTNTATSEVLSTAGSVYYYMEVSNPACSGDARIPVLINVGTASTPQIVSPSPICAGSTATLQVTGATGATIRWYATNTSTTVLGTGATFVTPALDVTTSYFAEITGSSCINVTGRLEGVVTVNPVPTVTTVEPPAICAGNTITLTATPSAGATLRWYRNIGDATPVATGNTYTTGVLNASTAYFVEAYNATTGCTSSRKAVNVQVYPLPAFTVTQPAAICSGNTVTITATPLYGATIRWYRNIGDVTPVATGNTYTTGILNASTTYYVEAYDFTLGCYSARQAVKVTVKDCFLPVNPHIRSVYK